MCTRQHLDVEIAYYPHSIANTGCTHMHMFCINYLVCQSDLVFGVVHIIKVSSSVETENQNLLACIVVQQRAVPV